MLTQSNTRFLHSLKGIIFDCDGVMFDTRHLNAKYYNKILELLGQEPLNKKQEELAFALTAEELFRSLIPAHRWEEAKEIRAKFPYAALIPYMKKAEGLASLLRFLRKKGIRCAVNTNRQNTMEQILEYFGLTPYFFPVMTAAKVTFAKPHPEGLHKILASWDLSPREVMFIGDSSLDMEAARRANTFFASYQNSQLRADVHFQSFHSVQTILAKSQASA